ncbi:hypothetical protein GCM10011502_28960 [Oceanisphaera marina]|uniref:Chemotaxis protein CheC n=1 Tax=Oceanisphaera marina TaxID=2017550 RepID=A0ABQ1J072_9GAMM|nr:chemotaxis protein CheX [Oceanisphaera marina]GGB54008.1 hypothetical protein GCM10011502_28960 [Oceanisphaera marina]
MNIVLTADEHELVVELMHIGVGRVANILSNMVRDEVRLSVPQLQVLSPAEASDNFCRDMPGVLAGVMQHFSGFTSGRAAVLFPEARSLELVRAILGEDMSIGEISELEQETLAELGNIFLNNCLVTLANLLNQKIQTDLPLVFNIDTPHLLSHLLPVAERSSSFIMLMKIHFSLRERNLEGYLAFIVDVQSADKFVAALQDYPVELVE